MAYTATAQVGMVLTARQVFDSTSLPAASAAGATLSHDQLNLDVSLPLSGVPMTDVVVVKVTLSGGAATLNLTSLTGTLGEAVSLSGKKVQAVIFKPASSNANIITVTEGASNGHSLMGSAWKIGLKSGQQFLWYGAEASDDVGASDLAWDFSGTGSQIMYAIILAG